MDKGGEVIEQQKQEGASGLRRKWVLLGSRMGISLGHTALSFWISPGRIKHDFFFEAKRREGEENFTGQLPYARQPWEITSTYTYTHVHTTHT